MSRSPDDPVAAWLASRVARGELPGAAWEVRQGRTLLSAGVVGHAEREPDLRPATVETPWDLASLTKPLCTALLALMLARDRVIDLTAAAGESLPELAGGPYAAVTLLDLGRHLAGLPAWHPLCAVADDLDGYLREIAALPPAGARGEPLYSDLGYLLLQAAIERHAGGRLDRLFAERVAAPLGLRRTGFASCVATGEAAATERGNVYERAMAGERGARYAWRVEMIRGEVHDANAHGLGGVAGHAGLFGTAAEVAVIARAMLEDPGGRLGRRGRERLLHPAAGGAGRTFGLAAAASSGAARGALPEGARGHTGFTGTSLWLEPDRGRIHVLLTNRIHPTVPPADFQPLRREFHRRAASL